MTTSSPEMEDSVLAVENIIHYSFSNKRLLEEALTHSSVSGFPSYDRLEFVGDAVLELAISNHLYLTYPTLDSGRLTLLRAANVSNEKLARVAIRHSIHLYLRRNPTLFDNNKVREFIEMVSEEEDAVAYGQSVKAPKVFADIVESVAGAVYMDVNYDLQKFWVIFGGLLEPIVTLDDINEQPQPVSMLYEICQKQGKKIDIDVEINGAESIASVYVDGQFIASDSSEQKEIARLGAAREALLKLANLVPANTWMLKFCSGIEGTSEIKEAQQKLRDLCVEKKWPEPVYSSLEKDAGPPHEKKFVFSVEIDGVFHNMWGEEKLKKKDARNSAASSMIRALLESKYL